MVEVPTRDVCAERWKLGAFVKGVRSAQGSCESTRNRMERPSITAVAMAEFGCPCSAIWIQRLRSCTPMLHSRVVLPLVTLLALGLSSCASHSVMPRTKALFAGLDESRLSSIALGKLAKAKRDFECVRACGKPCHASDVGLVSHSQSRRFAGDGYEITLVNTWSGFIHRQGPEIVIDPSITGGKPFRYDEIDVTDD